MGLLKCFRPFAQGGEKEGSYLQPSYAVTFKDAREYQVFLMLNTWTLQDLSITWCPFMSLRNS